MKNHILGSMARSISLSHVTERVQQGLHNLWPHASTTAPTSSQEGVPQTPSTLLQQLLISRPGQLHLIGRDWVTCHALAAREAGKAGTGILSSYSVERALY